MHPPGSWRRLATARTVVGVLLLGAALTVFTALGLWQYDGWAGQRAAEQRDLTDRAPVALSSLIGPDDPFPGDEVGRPVELSGRWVPDSGFLVGPRPFRGEDGWWVVAALALDDQPAAVPVVLGWTSRPRVTSPTGRVRVQGLLQPGEESSPPDPDPTDRVFPELRLASITQLVPTDLVSAYVVSRTTDPRTGLPPVGADQVPVVGVSTALKNLLYALQWWVFAFFAIVIWVRDVREQLGVGGRRTTGDGALTG